MLLFVDTLFYPILAFPLTFMQRLYENSLEILWKLIKSSRNIYLRMMRNSRSVTRGANYVQHKYLMSNNKY